MSEYNAVQGMENASHCVKNEDDGRTTCGRKFKFTGELSCEGRGRLRAGRGESRRRTTRATDDVGEGATGSYEREEDDLEAIKDT